jgi:uncharacterized integral membrane protein
VFRRLGADEYQGRLWAMLIGLFLLALYVIAFISKNDRRIEIDFVLFTATVSLIWLIVLILAVGMLGGVLLSQLYRRRGRDQRSKPRAGDGELGGRREAEGQPGG